jgi:hypothetical protein
MSVHLFGIRHHGVGSGRSLRTALEELSPDCILIEGPPDADDLMAMAADAQMQPPVALLVYDPDQPRRASWYPFAPFSPELQAIQVGVALGAALRFMDLPQKHMLALARDEEERLLAAMESPSDDEDQGESVLEEDGPALLGDQPPIVFDPLSALAAAAGEADGERWWSRVVEEARNPSEVFALIHEAMTAVRSDMQLPDSYWTQREELREAWMRTTIRAAEKQYARVAVVCGAWHTPALVDLKATKKSDAEMLKGLPSVKTVATFTPWTYSRLALHSGYGAGIASPGWYAHLWETQSDEVSARWLGRVATLLREEGLLASTAQVIDALRLSDMLATLRERSVGLDELNEASVAVLCGGHSEPMRLIERKLIIGEVMGSVPPDAPAVPLARYLSAQIKKLRMSFSDTRLELDLRKPNDLARSHLLHRLNLLSIPWGKTTPNGSRGKGTFHEDWALAWQPEFEIALVEASVWGNTVESAVVAFVNNRAAQATLLSVVTSLLRDAMLAALPEVIDDLVRRLHDLARLTRDIGELMDAAPPLVDTLRYGDVRKTQVALVEPVLESTVVSVCVQIVPASLNVDDEAALGLSSRILRLNNALHLAQDAALIAQWQGALLLLADSGGAHPLLCGAATQHLFRAEKIDAEDAALRMRRAFSVGSEPHYATYWLDGFLSSMEHVLLRDDALFTLVDGWLAGLGAQQFDELLPLLRRTFSTFGAPARRSLGERAAKGKQELKITQIDEARAARALVTLRHILGLEAIDEPR